MGMVHDGDEMKTALLAELQGLADELGRVRE
ncbi:MAG: hypothetical protein A07HR60_02340 [uncultured archaeon A07HR60]|nr:MAG: hypothetical protein A07HR60_02340 [uncultured archaeon A07HR60]